VWLRAAPWWRVSPDIIWNQGTGLITEDMPATFSAHGAIIRTRATYHPPENAKKGGMLFAIPELSEREFERDGMQLASLEPPRGWVQHNEGRGLQATSEWADAVSAFMFSIKAENAARTLPIILRDCRGG
jgi:hypothetical protein